MAAPSTKLWLPWGRGCVQNNGKQSGMCFAGNRPWAAALAPEPLANFAQWPATYRYGAMPVHRGAGANDTFALPIVTLIDTEHDTGVSLVLSPEVPCL